MDVSQTQITGTVTSRDGSTIGYRQIGRGPDLVLVHGAMQTSENFTRLAVALSDAFTVSVPDRRGRGLSAAHGDGYCMASEVEDLNALLVKTGAHRVFGLSSGALVALQTASMQPAIRKIALYEPPLAIAGQPSPLDLVPGYERALARGDLAAAMTAVLKGTGDRSAFTQIPGFIMTSLLRPLLWMSGKGYGPPVRALIPTVRFDIRIVTEMAGTLDRFKTLDTDVLLLGGTMSAAFLPPALDALERTLPHCRRVTLLGLGHLGADDTGAPERVADELKRFFL